jgi:hypothetical protein
LTLFTEERLTELEQRAMAKYSDSFEDQCMIMSILAHVPKLVAEIRELRAALDIPYRVWYSQSGVKEGDADCLSGSPSS